MLKNYAYVDVVSAIVKGIGLDPTPLLDVYNPEELQEYRTFYPLDVSVYWLAQQHRNQGVPFDAVSEKLLGVPKSSFYRHLSNKTHVIEGVVIGNEHTDLFKFLASGLKGATAEFKRTRGRLDELMVEPSLRPSYKPEPEEVDVEGDVGFEF